jgi:hypothetical protein
VDSCEDLDQRRFAGTVLAEQGNDFARPNRHADVGKGPGATKSL